MKEELKTEAVRFSRMKSCDLTRMRGGEDVACKYLKLGILEGSTKELLFIYFFFLFVNLSIFLSL